MGLIFSHILSNPEQFVGESGMEYNFPFWMWKYWPKTGCDQHLIGFYNAMVVPSGNTSWHSRRMYPVFLRPKFRLMKAVLA